MEEALSIKQVLGSLNVGCIREFFMGLYHTLGPGRKPYDPVSMLKAQLLKYLLRVPSDRRLALLLKRNRKMARACGFEDKTPSHGLFTHFRHRLGKEGYEKVFSMLSEELVENGVVEGNVVAVDSTAIKAYSQRDLQNKCGKSDREARVGRGSRGFILGYKVHTACCTSSELPLALIVQPCNLNEKSFIKPLLEKLRRRGIGFRAVVADAQYDSSRVRWLVKQHGAHPIIPYRRTSKLRRALTVGRNFIISGVKRLVKLFRRRACIERVFSRAKE